MKAACMQAGRQPCGRPGNRADRTVHEDTRDLIMEQKTHAMQHALRLCDSSRSLKLLESVAEPDRILKSLKSLLILLPGCGPPHVWDLSAARHFALCGRPIANGSGREGASALRNSSTARAGVMQGASGEQHAYGGLAIGVPEHAQPSFPHSKIWQWHQVHIWRREGAGRVQCLSTCDGKGKGRTQTAKRTAERVRLSATLLRIHS